MKKNVGGIDRAMRIVAGIVLIALAATGQIGSWGWFGVIVLATGAFSFCGARRQYCLITKRLTLCQSKELAPSA